MGARSHAQILVLIGAGAYLGISSPNIFRKLSVVKSFVAKPMMANWVERRLSSARLQSAGRSLRLVRSPLAPKITITQGEGMGFAPEWLRLMKITSSL